MTDDPPWMTDAECAGVDPDLFFPSVGESPREAKAICEECTVKADCLEYAIANNERHGVWGGQSERERRRTVRARRVASARHLTLVGGDAA